VGATAGWAHTLAAKSEPIIQSTTRHALRFEFAISAINTTVIVSLKGLESPTLRELPAASRRSSSVAHGPPQHPGSECREEMEPNRDRN
jgi:hypothetical protein